MQPRGCRGSMTGVAISKGRERKRMFHLPPMGDLVDDHEILNAVRCHDQMPGEHQAPVGGAAAPS